MNIPPTDAPRVFLIDAYAILYRSFYAFRSNPLTNARGEDTSAPFGFANFLFTLRDDCRPDYLAVVFDAGDSQRKELYPGYKGSRSEMPEQLRDSLPRIVEMVEAFGDKVVSAEGWEADDVIGTLARRALERGLEPVIVSGDKDFMQLVGDGVAILNPGSGGRRPLPAHWVDEDAVRRKLGVDPSQVVDYLALVGDASDDVPGAPGIGRKTAAALLDEYGTLDETLARAPEVKGKRPRESLLAHRDDILLSRRLVTIRTDVPVDLDVDELRVGAPDDERLRALFVELDFQSMLDRLDGGAPGAPPLAAAAPARYALVSEAREIAGIAQACRDAGAMAVAALTTTLRPARGPLAGLAVASAPDAAHYLPLGHEEALALESEEAGDGRNLPPLDSAPMRPVRDALADPGIVKVGHDLKRSLVALGRFGVELAGPCKDVMVASYVLDPTRSRQNLRSLATDFLRAEVTPLSQVLGKGRARRAFGEVSPAQALSFACEQAVLPLRLWSLFSDRLEAAGRKRDDPGRESGEVGDRLLELFDALETPLIPILAGMESAGVAIDEAFFARMSEELRERSAQLREDVFLCAGAEFNVHSTPQLREILFERLGLPVLKRTKTGPSTDSAVLEELAATTGHPLPERILEYRRIEKLRNTYVDALPSLVAPETGRIHTTFNQTVAATGRLSSSDPNLQNIPIRTELGRRVRRGFVAAPGKVLLAADYSQIELRVLAHLSGDDVFVRAFRENKDVHVETAAVVFGVSAAQVDAEMRDRAKTVNFATLYGQGAFGLSRRLKIPADEAKRFIDEYFERFSRVRDYLDEQVERARTLGYVETMLGRRRSVPELHARAWNVRRFGERVAWNTPIQGTAADLIKRAMIRLGAALERRPGVQMLLQVHDELVLEVDEDEVDDARDTAVSVMEGALDLHVPLRVDVGVGRTWYDCKGS